MSFILLAPFGEPGESGLEVFNDFGGDVNASRFNAVTVHRFNHLRITVHDSRFCSDFRPLTSDSLLMPAAWPFVLGLLLFVGLRGLPLAVSA